MFNFDLNEKSNKAEESRHSEHKLMASAIRSGNAMTLLPSFSFTQSESMDETVGLELSFSGCSTVCRTCNHVASSSGITLMKKKKPRKGPDKSKRKLKEKAEIVAGESFVLSKGVEKGFLEKRKASEEFEGPLNTALRSKQKMVPKEEPSAF